MAGTLSGLFGSGGWVVIRGGWLGFGSLRRLLLRGSSLDNRDRYFCRLSEDLLLDTATDFSAGDNVVLFRDIDAEFRMTAFSF